MSGAINSCRVSITIGGNMFVCTLPLYGCTQLLLHLFHGSTNFDVDYEPKDVARVNYNSVDRTLAVSVPFSITEFGKNYYLFKES